MIPPHHSKCPTPTHPSKTKLFVNHLLVSEGVPVQIFREAWLDSAPCWVTASRKILRRRRYPSGKLLPRHITFPNQASRKVPLARLKAGGQKPKPHDGVRVRGIEVVAVGVADEVLIEVERTPAQRAGGVARRLLSPVLGLVGVVLVLTARPLPHTARQIGHAVR